MSDDNNEQPKPEQPTAANAIKPPNVLQGQCPQCNNIVSTTLPPVQVANTMDLSFAIVNHPKFITCHVCQAKFTILCEGAQMGFIMQYLSPPEVELGKQAGMIDDTLIEVVRGANVHSMLRGLKRPQ